MSAGLNRLLGRLFGGVTPDLLLDADSLASVRQRARPIRRRFYLWTAPLLLLAVGAMAVGLTALRAAMDGPATNAIVDDGPVVSFLCFVLGSFFVVLFPAGLIENRVLPRMLGFEQSLWVRYYASSTGWRPDRAIIAAAIIGVPAVVFMMWGGFVTGDRVDEGGISYLSGPWRSLEPYGQVAAVEVYDGVNAPVGVLMRPNLVVRFSGGGEWRYDPQRAAGPTPLDVGEYIAKRAGKTVAQGGLRP